MVYMNGLWWVFRVMTRVVHVNTGHKYEQQRCWKGCNDEDIWADLRPFIWNADMFHYLTPTELCLVYTVICILYCYLLKLVTRKDFLKVVFAGTINMKSLFRSVGLMATNFRKAIYFSNSSLPVACNICLNVYLMLIHTWFEFLCNLSCY